MAANATLAADPARAAWMGLGKHGQRVIRTVRQGQSLCRMHCAKATGDVETSWWFEPSGRGAPPVASDLAARSPFLAPVGDGLFEGVACQSWQAGEPPPGEATP